MAQQDKVELIVDGMTCDDCVRNVVRALKRVPGVLEANVPGWQSRQASAVVDHQVGIEELIAVIEKRGYRAALKTRQPVVEIPRTMPHLRRGTDSVDLMVIGAGSAGFAAAIKAVEFGFRVALVEQGTIGGTCVNIGCVPSKTLIRAVEQLHRAGQHPFSGIQTVPGRLSWPEVIAHKDELVAQMRQSKYVDVLATYPDITYLQGQARLLGKNGVEIDGQTYTPGKIIVATGSNPWAPAIPGLEEAGYLNSTTAMELKELPRSMIVLGANAIGLEQAQLFARAGSYVTVLELLPRVAPFEDEAISVALASYLEKEGIRLMTGVQASRVERRDGRHVLVGYQNGQELCFEAEQLLVATGRRPNTAGFGLKESGVQLGDHGEIVVDATLKTTNPNIYAAGDVLGRDMFVYVAAYGGGLAAENALTSAERQYDASYIPHVTFTDPQVASVGLTEAEAREQSDDVKVSMLPLEYVPRALAARDTRGLIKLVADTATDRLLGAHILAPEAGEMIQTAVLSIRFGIPLAQLRETLFPYLTNVEGLKLAALAFEKDVALLSCCAG